MRVAAHLRQPTMRSQNVTQKMRKMSLLLEKSPLFRTSSAWSTERSFVENDGPPSFEGAADGGYAPRFLSIFLALGFSRFDGESTLPLTAGNAPRWAARSYSHPSAN